MALLDMYGLFKPSNTVAFGQGVFFYFTSQPSCTTGTIYWRGFSSRGLKAFVTSKVLLTFTVPVSVAASRAFRWQSNTMNSHCSQGCRFGAMTRQAVSLGAMSRVFGASLQMHNAIARIHARMLCMKMAE